jgi:hypothetical protein
LAAREGADGGAFERGVAGAIPESTMATRTTALNRRPLRGSSRSFRNVEHATCDASLERGAARQPSDANADRVARDTRANAHCAQVREQLVRERGGASLPRSSGKQEANSSNSTRSVKKASTVRPTTVAKALCELQARPRTARPTAGTRLLHGVVAQPNGQHQRGGGLRLEHRGERREQLVARLERDRVAAAAAEHMKTRSLQRH